MKAAGGDAKLGKMRADQAGHSGSVPVVVALGNSLNMVSSDGGLSAGLKGAIRPVLAYGSPSAPNTKSRPRCHSLPSRHRGATADLGPLIRRALLDIRGVKSSILERNVLRIGDVFAL
jgi:hypothetical protein